MRCESCGTELAEDAAFCPECGERSPARSADEMVDLAHTEGLVRGRQAGEVPDAPEMPEVPDGVPEIPDAAPLPDAPGMAIPGGEAASSQVTTGFLDKARLREEKRRAAQALVESAQTELREELADIAEKESLIQQRGYDLGDIYPTEEPPPPPAEERMWAETRERAREHNVEVTWQEDEPTPETGGQDARRLGEKLEASVEEDGSNCCGYGCLALFVVLFLFFVLGFIMNVAQ